MIQGSFLFFVLGVRALKDRTGHLFIALSGLFVGLAALTHEELLLAGGGYVVLLLAGVRLGAERRASVRPAAINAAIFITCMSIAIPWVILGARQYKPQHLRPMALDRLLSTNTANWDWPLRILWNAVTANSSALVSSLLLLLILVTVVAIVRMMLRAPKVNTPVALSFHVPVVIILTHTALYSLLITWMNPRYFLPLMPLILASLSIWTGKILQGTTRKITPVILTAMTLLIVVLNTSSYGATAWRRSRRGDNQWTPATAAVSLDPAQGFKKLHSVAYKQKWARALWEELKDRVHEDSRLLVTSSIMFPFAGRRVLQVRYYFGDNASYLIDHDEPLEQLIKKLKIKYLLFTTYLRNERVLRSEQSRRYQYDGKWSQPRRLVLGASYGFEPGEYTVAGEYRFLHRYLEDNGARVLLTSGDFLRQRSETFDRSNPAYVVYALDPNSSRDFKTERKAIASSERLVALGDIAGAEQTLRAASKGVIGLSRLRLRLQMTSVYQAAGRPDDALAELDGVVDALQQGTSLSAVIGELYNSRPEIDTAIELHNDLLEIAPDNIAVRAVLASLQLLPFSSISGVTTPHKLFDGRKHDPAGYSTAPLDSPILFEFARPMRVEKLSFQLYDLDGRFYRFTVEARTADVWRTCA